MPIGAISFGRQRKLPKGNLSKFFIVGAMISRVPNIFLSQALRGLLISFSFLLCDSVSAAQTGGQLPRATELASGDALTAAPSGDSISGVDLRRYFPPIGTQSMNDCTAWATAAAKSCLEAMDQGWVPDRPQTMFSPAFIYPQINQGKDEGSSLVAAALLLEKMGAATLKTTPYQNKDFLSQPPEFAFEEAGRFKNRSTFVLQDREQIKIALRENLPVLIGARLTPPFFSGTAESYTMAMHQAGMAERQADQPHAMHAMVIVGFDEPSERFLLRNSWGEGWGKGGYCWVDYAVIDAIDASADADSFLFLALAMEDEAMDAEATPDVGEDLKQSISLRVRGEHAGFDRLRKKTTYRLQGELLGPSTAIDLVSKVTWQVPSRDDKTQTLITQDGARRFRVLSAVVGEQHPILAQVEFKDGSSAQLELTTQFVAPTAKDRTLSFRHEDLYWGDGFSGDKDPNTGEFLRGKMWRRRVWVDGSMSDLRDVVSYTVESGGHVFEHEPNAGKAAFGATYMKLTAPAPLVGHFLFVDGTRLTIRKEISTFEDLANDDVFIKSEIHRVGDGQMSAFRLFLRMPIQIEEGSMEDVIWELDGSQEHRNHRRVFEEWNRFEVTGSATRDFRARATISFYNGRAPIVVEKWIELPDDGTEYPTPLRIDIWPTSFYAGRVVEEVPIWNFGLRLSGDWQATEKVLGAQFSFHDAYGKQQRVTATKATHGDWEVSLSSMPQSFPVIIEVETLEGTIRLEKEIASSKPIVDGIFLDSRTYSHWPRIEEYPDLRWTAELGGARWGSAVEVVEYLYQARLDNRKPSFDRNTEGQLLKPNYWRSILRRSDGTLNQGGQIMRTAAVPGEVRARLHYQNGRTESLVAKIPAQVSEELRGRTSTNPITVRAMERFLGADATEPFQMEVWLEGSTEALNAVDYMQFWAEGQTPLEAQRIKPEQHLVSRYAAPRTYRLRLAMKDDSVEEYHVEASCMSRRFRTLQISRSQYLIGLQGPGESMDAIQTTTFFITPEGGETASVVGAEYSFGAFSNAASWSDTRPASVRVEIEFLDGSTTTLQAQVALPQELPPALVTEDFFWGFDNGEPLWLLHHHVPFAGFPGGKATRQLNLSGRSYLPSFAWPDFEVLEVQPFLSADLLAIPSITLDFNDDSWIQLPPVEGYTVQSPIEKELGLTVSRTWKNSGKDAGAKHEWQMRVTGPWSQLDVIDHVQYSVIYPRDEARYRFLWNATERYSLDSDGFPAWKYAEQIESVTAQVHFRDGRDILNLNWQQAK